MQKKFELQVDLMGSEDLQDILTKILSGMLPHENYDHKKFGIILNATKKIIHLSEMKMEYYVMFHILSSIRQIQIHNKDYIPRITSDFISNHMSTEAVNYVLNPRVGVREWTSQTLNANDGVYSSAESEEERVLQENTNRLFSRVMDLYDSAYELAVSSDEAMAHTLTLKEVFRGEVARACIDTQLKVLQYGVSNKGWEFNGSRGWEQYVSRVLATLRIRLDSKDLKVTVINDLESIAEMTDKMLGSISPLAAYGYPPLDQSTSMRRNWMTVVVGNEGTGKTAWLVSDTVTLLRAGHKVLYMTGESSDATIFSRIVSNFIHAEHKLKIPPELVAKPEMLKEEHQRLIRSAMIELTKYRDDGSLMLISSLNYWTLSEDLVALHEQYEFDALMIDHSSALKGGKELYTNIELLTNALIDFKKDYPVYVCVASHLSSEARALLQKGKTPDSGTTKGNGALSQGADMVLVLYANEEMQEKKIVSAMVNKIRGQRSSMPKFVLQYMTEISCFRFREEDQKKLQGYMEHAEEAIDRLAKKFDGDSTEEYEDFDFDEEDEFDEDEDPNEGLVM